MKTIACLLTAGLLASTNSAWAAYEENWDTGANDWKYWAEDLISPVRLGGSDKPMQWSLTGGWAGSGYVSAPLGSLYRTWGRYWPAYQAPPAAGVVELAGQVLSIRGNDFASSNLPADSLRMFIGEWISDTNYVFFAHNTPLSLGRDTWGVVGTAIIGGDPDWHEIARVGSSKTPSDLYSNPQQWGIVIETPLGLGAPPTGTLGFDELHIEAGPIYRPANGHYYEAVEVATGVTWETADTQARAAWDGTGTLATITSAQENEFVASLVTEPRFWADGGKEYGPWLGGYQSEQGQEPDGGWNWLTGEGFYGYTRWNYSPPEPNDGDGNWEEDKLHFINTTGEVGNFYWNDAQSSAAAPLRGYIIEWDHNPIPEPATLALLAVGGLALIRRRRFS